MDSYQPILELALTLAEQAGEEIRRQRSELEITFKQQGAELVTQADVAADQLISDGIRRYFPDHQLLSEELAPDNQLEGEYLWVIDPIDGTVNFAHQHYQAAVSIACYHRGKACVGVVHNPFLNETFHAVRNGGAFLNQQPIHCSDKTELHRALVATGFPYTKETLPQLMARLQTVLQHCADIRRLGSAALDICWVAAGRMDAYYESVKPWDMAAAQLIAQEAGARVGHIHPLPAGCNEELHSDNVLITVPALFEPLQQLLQQADAGFSD